MNSIQVIIITILFLSFSSEWTPNFVIIRSHFKMIKATNTKIELVNLMILDDN